MSATLERPEALRQSIIAAFDRCPLSTLFDLQTELRQPSWLAARGTLAHRFFADALDFMRRNNESQIPVDMAMELLQEVIAQRDLPAEEVVHLPMRELRWLRVLATKFAYRHTYSVDKVVDVERRLYATIKVRGPGGLEYERTISGQLDVLLAELPDGATVVDYKTGWAPAARIVESAERQGDRLSDMGYAQQVIYGYLVMANYPAVQWVALREYYVMSDEVREARIERWEMERVADVLAAIVAQVDAAIDEGPGSKRWFPVPGAHCAMCIRPRDCPVRDEIGIPVDEREAQLLGQEWVVTNEARKEQAKLLKGWVDTRGPIEVRHAKGRRAIGWVENSTGNGRRFALHEPAGAPESPFDPMLAASRPEVEGGPD